MVKAYVEQWYIWLLLDLIQSVKWLIETIRGREHAAMMLIMFLFFTANAIYGLIQWSRLEKSENNRK